MKKLLLAIILVLSSIWSAEARTCDTLNVCNAFTHQCTKKVGYMTWGDFTTWVNNNQNTPFTVVWSSSANVRFVYDDLCTYETQCWDNQGECEQ